jgi:hypothetical protein
LLCGLAIVGFAGGAVSADDAGPDVKPAGSGGSLAAPAPAVPGEVVVLMQAGKFDEALAKLLDARSRAKDDDERAYFDYLKAIGERSAGRRDAARATLEAALKDFPKSIWSNKIRFELALVEQASGNHERAEELARAEASPLLADDRKDRLAEVYQSFATHLLKPDDPAVPADPGGAWDLLAQARLLAKGEAVRAGIELAMGRASLALKQNDRAVQEFRDYLRDHPKGADRFAARLALGEALLAANRPLDARLTWIDLARDVEKLKPDDVTEAAREARMLALAEIP